jgi:hypothetical protein
MAFKLSIEQGKGRGQAFDFDAATITIGRTEENDVVLYEQGVSRKRARISLQAGKNFVEDLDSANGTLLNGAKIKREALSDGDTVGIGAVIFRFGDAPKGTKDETAPRIVAPASKDDRTPAGVPVPEKTPVPASAAALAPASGAPVFNPRYVVMGVSGALIIAIGWAAIAGRVTAQKLDQCPTAPIRLEGQSVSSMVFSTTGDSVCKPGKELNFGFVGQPRTRYLFSYQAFYTEKNGIEVFVNGEKKEGSPLATTRRSKPSEILIDDKQIKVGRADNNENVISFRSNRANWGIERVELTALPIDGANLDQALEYFHLGEQLYEQKNVAARNLYDAYVDLKKSRQLMEGLLPQPADYVVVKQLIQTVNGELDTLCQNKLFLVKREQTFGKFESANDGYKYLLVAFPGDEHPCRARVIDQIGGPQRVKTIFGSTQQ